ncbi:MAG: UDP-2,3-diacylglucosamine diphosphatase [Candidatus Hydrogenedentes bacterium]|nr:UDP-2,3-diacylglucosamine diphosphatase [Candidatus Hydrogenedentota bacterium]
MNTVIVSDVHLRVAESGQASMSDFVRFLRGLEWGKIERFIILGDLFDFWFEYRHVIFSGYFDVLRAFADMADHGIEIHFICGNHDFWAGRFLEKQLKFSLHWEPMRLQLGPHRVLLVHGDGLNPKDVGYRIYKRIARRRPVVWLFSLLHPDRAMRLGQWVSGRSRHLLSAKDPRLGSEVAPLQEFARRTLAGGEADVVLCGHSHYPVVEEFPTPNGPGRYINAGDWLVHRSYVVWDGSEFRLESYSNEQRATSNEQ